MIKQKLERHYNREKIQRKRENHTEKQMKENKQIDKWKRQRQQKRERKGKIQMVTSTDSQTFDKVAQFFNERK